MMKINIDFRLVCLMAIFFVSFASCISDDYGDSVKPVINLISPVEGAILKIGSDVHFDMELYDDTMLKSYKINIHSSFDGHTHSRASDATIDFIFNKSWEVNGKNAKVHHHEIVIPENATPGSYHMMIYCSDAAGNESYVARNIYLEHDGVGAEH